MISAHAGNSIQTGIFNRFPRVHDTDRTISSLRSAKDLQGNTMKRVKGVEDLNVRFVRAQGIVGVGVTIRTCT